MVIVTKIYALWARHIPHVDFFVNSMLTKPRKYNVDPSVEYMHCAQMGTVFYGR